MRIEIKPRIRINTDGSIDMFIRKVLYKSERAQIDKVCPACNGIAGHVSCPECRGKGFIFAVDFKLIELFHSGYILSLPGPRLADDISDQTKVLNTEWIPVKEGGEYPQEHWFHIPKTEIIDQASVEAFRQGKAEPSDPRQEAIEECIRFVAEPCGDTIEDMITAGLAADLRAHMEKQQ